MYAGTLACARKPIPAFHYSVAEVGGEDEVACADYHTYGTPALADAVLDALGEDSGEGAQMAALMANHGAVAVGADLDEAFYYAERVENLSEMYWRSLQVPGGPVCLTAAQMADSRARDRGYGQEPESGEREDRGRDRERCERRRGWHGGCSAVYVVTASNAIPRHVVGGAGPAVAAEHDRLRAYPWRVRRMRCHLVDARPWRATHRDGRCGCFGC